MKAAIVGLGPAGLHAASILEASGVEVELFDARDRIGGRLQTISKEGLVYDAGAEWIDAQHNRVLALARSFGLEPLPSMQWPGKVAYKGEWTDEANPWPDAQVDESRLDRDAAAMLDEMEVKEVSHTLKARLDGLSVNSFIRKVSLSERGAWWLTAKYRSDEGEDLERIGLLGWLRTYKQYRGRVESAMSAFRIPGGMGALVSAMAARLKATPNLKKLLVRVERGQNQVTLHFGDGGKTTVDQAVLALPAAALKNVEFSPMLSVKKQDAIAASRMARALKIALAFSANWWTPAGWTGRMLTDRPIQQTWDGTLGTTPVLNIYICGAAADAFAKRPDPARLALEDLAGHFPQAKDLYVEGFAHNWTGDPHSQGGFSIDPPGYSLTHFENIRTLEGRIHFAGEHTAEWTGFVEGALESAERVATEVKLA
jgi:monoamine oxidase